MLLISKKFAKLILIIITLTNIWSTRKRDSSEDSYHPEAEAAEQEKTRRFERKKFRPGSQVHWYIGLPNRH